MTMDSILQFSKISLLDSHLVGGKNASLGEMICHLSSIGINIPDGFATTTAAYNEFLTQNHLDREIKSILQSLDVGNLQKLETVSSEIRQLFLEAEMPPHLVQEVLAAYHALGTEQPVSVAVRSSATAEDLSTSSFAGQQESYLNVCGSCNVLKAIQKVYASLFTPRAIAYREHQGFDHRQVSISVGIQKMVRSDLGSSGVVFTLDTESGFDHVIFITASYGLGEMIVQGAVNPDEFFVDKSLLKTNKQAILKKNLGAKKVKKIYKSYDDFSQALETVEVEIAQQLKFCLSDHSIHELAKHAITIENHYKRPMDIEWAIDGIDEKIYILQARPETVKSVGHQNTIERFKLTSTGKLITFGRSIGERIGQGKARVIASAQNMGDMRDGEVIVTEMTDPDWEPVMKRASAIVTDKGGRTCHAAIVARELGIPAVVGCGEASKKIKNSEPLTVCCAEGETGFVYSGILTHEIERISLKNTEQLPIKLCMNLGNPGKAFTYQAIPNDGVGLTRLEFIISHMIGVHPQALLHFNTLARKLQREIYQKISAYSSPREFYIEKLREGVSTIAAAFYPKPVIVRFSDFKSNEYASLLGGSLYEPQEENPMIGFRGASRYLSKQFRHCFELECIALKRVREAMGLTNVKVMIPFVRTLNEAQETISLMNSFGLIRGENDLEIYMMCELPSNAVLAEDFLAFFDGFSIGSNDLTQLTLGVDRDSAQVADLFDERDKAVKHLLHKVIVTCKNANKYIGICGQGPSDHLDFAKWLVDEGISCLSLSPDSLVRTRAYLANAP